MSSNSALIKDSQRPIELLGHQVFEISTTKNFAFQYSLWNKKKTNTDDEKISVE